MIKIALKHFIYEKCISILFDTINRNFRIPKVKKFSYEMFHFYQHYGYIKACEGGMVYVFYNCTVDKITPTTIVIVHEKTVKYDKNGNKIYNTQYTQGGNLTSIIYYDQIIETSSPRTYYD